MGYAYDYLNSISTTTGFRGANRDVKRRTRATYEFTEFVRPDGYWPSPYSIDQAFAVFGWMIETGKPYQDRTRWGRQSVFSLLSAKPTCVNFSSVNPIVSLTDLIRRFHYAILSGHVGPQLRQWRKDHGIAVGSKRTIQQPHYRLTEGPFCEADMKSRVANLLGASGRLAAQLNEYHDDAREVYGVEFRYWKTWELVLAYGIEGSRWYHTLAVQRKSEPVFNAVMRAEANLAELMTDEDSAREAKIAAMKEGSE